MSEEEVKAGPFYMPSFGFTTRIAKRILINNFLPSSLKERVHCKTLRCTVLYFMEGLYKLAPYLLRMFQECSHTLYSFKQNLSSAVLSGLGRPTQSLPEVSIMYTCNLCDGWKQFSSVTQSCPILCDSIDCSMPGFPVHHQLLELAQTYVHRVGDAIQPSHPLSSPSPPAISLPQHQGLF